MEERGQRGKELIHQTHQPLISRRTKGHPCKAASSAIADPRPRVVSARCETLSHPRPEGPSQTLLSPLRSSPLFLLSPPQVSPLTHTFPL